MFVSWSIAALLAVAAVKCSGFLLHLAVLPSWPLSVDIGSTTNLPYFLKDFYIFHFQSLISQRFSLILKVWSSWIHFTDLSTNAWKSWFHCDFYQLVRFQPKRNNTGRSSKVFHFFKAWSNKYPYCVVMFGLFPFFSACTSIFSNTWMSQEVRIHGSW